MRRQVIKVTDGPFQYKVIHDDEAKTKPYKVFEFKTFRNDQDWLRSTQKQRQIVSCEDLVSCLRCLEDLIASPTQLPEKTVIKETFKRR